MSVVRQSYLLNFNLKIPFYNIQFLIKIHYWIKFIDKEEDYVDKYL